jgi:nucleotide-binding universal stress UspA family protein
VQFNRILVPVDFTPGSERALRHAAALAQAHRARVLPVHVTPAVCFTIDYGYGPVNRVEPDKQALRQTRARLESLVHRLVPAALTEAVTIRSGQPIEQILLAAREWKADLIVMLAHDSFGKASSAPTHTVDGLMRAVQCPVMLLHPPTPSRKARMLLQSEASKALRS